LRRVSSARAGMGAPLGAFPAGLSAKKQKNGLTGAIKEDVLNA